MWPAGPSCSSDFSGVAPAIPRDARRVSRVCPGLSEGSAGDLGKKPLVMFCLRSRPCKGPQTPRRPCVLKALQKGCPQQRRRPPGPSQQPEQGLPSEFMPLPQSPALAPSCGPRVQVT